MRNIRGKQTPMMSSSPGDKAHRLYCLSLVRLVSGLIQRKCPDVAMKKIMGIMIIHVIWVHPREKKPTCLLFNERSGVTDKYCTNKVM